MPSITITVSWWAYLGASALVVGLIACGYWCGRLDRRDNRVLAGIGENDARFQQMRRYAGEQRAKLVATLARLAAARDPRQAFHTISAELVLAPNDERRDGDDWPDRDEEPRGTADLSVWQTGPEERVGRHRWELLDADTRPLSRHELASAIGMRSAQ